MEIICVLNPTAGRGKAKRKWEACNKILVSQGIKIKTLETKGPGDATNITQEAIKAGAKTIIVAGGDGTLSEVIRAASGSAVKVAIAPFGTGNDLARGFEIPLDENIWAKAFPSFVSQEIDLGIVNGNYFINQAGFGFDAQVAHKINSGIPFVTGKLAYLIAIALCLKDLKAIDVEIRVDGNKLRKKVLMVSFANNPFVGGGLMTAPLADPKDGYLDLFLLEEVSRFELIKSFPLLLKGTHGKHPAVSFYRGKNFILETEFTQPMHIDGELYSGKSLEVTVKAQGVKILVPQGYLTERRKNGT